VKPFVVGIAGGTASGKSSIADAVTVALDALRVTHDRYYRDADADTNFDHPDSLETELLVTHLDALRAGRAAELPDYDFASHRRLPVRERVQPRAILVVEGILVLSHPELRARMDLTVFVDAPADVRLIRRVRRDVVERGRTVESVFSQYQTTVRPMHETYVEPSKAHAELVLDGSGSLAAQTERLVRMVRGRVG
jgi:uridine kinase